MTTTPDSPNSPEQFPSEASGVALVGPAGPLEAMLDVPETAEARPGVAVICHPHPQHGGTMHNKVVTILERSLREMGLATVRFNFRGVGESAGSFDDGVGETDDLLAVADWARRVRPGEPLWLAGFSFGSYVALRGAEKLQPELMILIAPPVERFDFVELPHPGCPWLLVQGEEDDVVSPQAVYDWVADLDDPPQLIRMEETGHFFHRRLMDLRGVIKNGVRRLLS